MSQNPITPHFNSPQNYLGFSNNLSQNNSQLNKLEIHQSNPQTRQSYTFAPRKSESDVHVTRSAQNTPPRPIVPTLNNYDLDLKQAQNIKYPSDSNSKQIFQKSQREKDLEVKLTMVLAQNEKLNQIIEQISPIKDKSRDSVNTNFELNYKLNSSFISNPEQRKTYNEQDKLINDLLAKERDVHTLNERNRELVARNMALSEENAQLKASIQEFEANSKNRFIEVNLDILHQNETERKLLIALNTDLQIKVMTLNEELNGHIKIIAEQEAQIQFFKLELQKYLEIEARMINEINEFKRNYEPQEILQTKLKEALLSNERFLASNQELKEQLNKIMQDVVNVQALQIHQDLAQKPQIEEKEDSSIGDNAIFVAENTILELNNRIASLLKDNEQSNSSLFEKIRENEALRRELDEARAKLVSQPSSHPLQYPITNEDLAEFEEYKLKIIELSQENEKLRYTISLKQEEIDLLKQRKHDPIDDKSELVDQLNQRIKTLAEELQIKDGENEIWRRKNEEMSNYSIEAEQLKAQIDLLSQENEALRRDKIAKEGNEIAIQQLNAKIISLNEELALKETELAQAKRRPDDTKLGIELNQLRSQLQHTTQENERLSHSSSEKVHELEDAKKKIIELEGKLEMIDQLNFKLLATGDELEAKRAEIALLEKNIEEKDLALKDIETLKRQMILLSQENERLDQLATEKTAECDRGVEKIAELEYCMSENKSLVEHLERIKEENQSLKACLGEVMGEVETMRKKVLESRFNEEVILNRITERMKLTNAMKESSIVKESTEAKKIEPES